MQQEVHHEAYFSYLTTTINGENMNKVSRIFTMASFLLLATLLPEFARAYTVSGTISLPSGISPLTYDTTIQVNLLKWDSPNQFSETLCNSPILLAGTTSLDYSCEYTDADGFIGIGVRTSIPGVWFLNYYNSTSTVFYSGSASKLSPSTDNPNINFSLLRQISISGRLTTPDFQTFPEDHTIYVWTKYRLPGSQYYNFAYGYSYVLPANHSYVDHSALLPEGTDVLVRYEFPWNVAPPSGIYPKGYYSSTGTQYVETAATSLSLSEDLSDLNLTLLQAKTISGTLLLQEGDTFPQETNVWLSAYTYPTNTYITGSSSAAVLGADSVSFSLSVPYNIESFIVRYSFWPEASPYLDYGYIGRTTDGFAITPCEVGTDLTLSDNLTDLSLPLPKYPSTSGTVSLPVGVSPNVDIPLEVGLIYPDKEGNFNDAGFRSNKQLTIAAGQNSTPYSIQSYPNCSPDPHVVGYRQTSNDYIRYGYYSTNGTVGNPNNAQPLLLAGTESLENINLQFIPGTAISGTISLPSDVSPPAEGLPITLGALANPDGIYHTTVIIPSGSQSVDYSVRVAPDVGPVALSYWLPEDLPVAPRGYYRQDTMPDQVTGRYGAADKFSHEADVIGNNFTLGLGNTVSGVIQLPEAISRTVPIEVKLADDLTDPESNYWHTSVVVPESSQNVSYSRRVLLDSTAKMMFSNNYIKLWAPRGYFLNSSVSTPIAGQTTVLSANEDHPDTNLFLAAMLPGDTNFDGQINLTDVILSLQVMTKIPNIEAGITDRADVNSDGKLGLEETIYILKEVSTTP